jgi:hypothetical protein
MVKKHHHIHETRDEWANRTTTVEAFYAGFLTLFIGLFMYGLGQTGVTHFQSFENILGFCFFMFLALLFRNIIKVDWYHNLLNSFLLPIMSILFTFMVYGLISEMIKEFNWLMLSFMLFIMAGFGYETRRSYNRSYLGLFIKRQIRKLSKYWIH